MLSIFTVSQLIDVIKSLFAKYGAHALLLFATAALPTVHSMSIIDPVLLPRILFTVLTLVAVQVWKIQKPDHGLSYLQVVRSPWMWAMLAFIVLGGIQLFFSLNTAEAIASWLRDVMYLSLLAVFIQGYKASSDYFNDVVRAVLVAATIVLGVGFYQLAQLSGVLQNPDLSYEVISTMAHRNLFAGASVLCSVFGIYAAFKLKGFSRWLGAAVFIVAVVVVLMLKARSALLAMILMYLFAGALLILKKVPAILSLVKPKYTVIALALLIGGAVTYSVLWKDVSADQSWIKNDSGRNFTVKERSLMWNGTLAMAKDFPMGVGPGNWKIHFPKYGSGIWRARQGLVQFQRPHNDALWVIAENGIVGGVLYLTFFIGAFISGLYKWIEEEDKDDRWKLVLALSVLVGFWIIAMFSFPKERPMLQWLLMLSAGYLLSFRVSGQSGKERAWLPYVLLPVFSVMLFVQWERVKGEQLSRRLEAMRAYGSWEESIDQTEEWNFVRLYSVDPASTPIYFYSSLAEFNLGRYELAIEKGLQALEHHPYHIHTINNIGGAYQYMNDYPNAVEYYSKALEIAPFYHGSTLNLASALFNSGDPLQAYEVLREHEGVFIEQTATFESYLQVVLETIYLNLFEELKPQSQVPTEVSSELLIRLHQESVQGGTPILEIMAEEMQTR